MLYIAAVGKDRHRKPILNQMALGKRRTEDGHKQLGNWPALALVVIITMIVSVLAAGLVLNVLLHQ